MNTSKAQLLLNGGGRYLTDGGIETTLIFHEGWQLPIGEAFTLIETEAGRAALTDYFERYIALAKGRGVGFLLESPTWRANPDWASKIGWDHKRLAHANAQAIALMRELRAKHETDATPVVISGCIGPRGDGYRAEQALGVDDAEAYHAWQIDVLADAGADLVSAITMTSTNEALGVAAAAKARDVPCVISFTLETDGRLPSGETLADAISTLDRDTGRWPLYYMINCAHPTHFDAVLRTDEHWVKRIGGLRANASKLSHQELDNSPELDTGNPDELGQEYRDLLRHLPHLRVLGGCCGTDHRHVAAISKACM